MALEDHGLMTQASHLTEIPTIFLGLIEMLPLCESALEILLAVSELSSSQMPKHFAVPFVLLVF